MQNTLRIPTPADDLAIKYHRKLLNSHETGTEQDISDAFRDFVRENQLVIDESRIQAQRSPDGQSLDRVDLVVNNTFVEMKKQLMLQGQINPAHIGQLDRYLLAASNAGNNIQNGLLTDGRNFLKFRIGEQDSPLRANQLRTFDNPQQGPILREYLSEIFNTDATDITPSTDMLTKYLGIDSELLSHATGLLKEAYEQNHDNPTVAVKRKLWQELLQVALGQDSTEDPVINDWLYIRHTYLTSLLSIIIQKTFGIDVEQEAVNDPKSLLNGDTLRYHTQLKGVIESDLFQWPTEINATRYIEVIAQKVAQFDWTQTSREMAATLYQNTITPEERKKMGEYYTPHWLAQSIVTELINNPADTVSLDPSCGSGTFIECLVKNLIQAQAGRPPQETLEKLQNNIIGIDLHPVAVQLAKATWVLASQNVITDAKQECSTNTEIIPPIYLGDALQLRYDHNTLDAQGYITLKTNETLPNQQTTVEFQVPLSLACQPDKFDPFMMDLAKAIDFGQNTQNVLANHQLDQGPESEILQQTAEKMRQLHAINRNHIWSYYLRNMVRPVAIAQHKVDAIVGNPPWITYHKTSDIIRSELRSLSENTYSIWAGGKLAPHQDFATLFFTRVTDLYLKDEGKIGMVLPHSILRSGQHKKWRAAFWQTKAKQNKSAITVDFHSKTPWDLDNLEPNDFFPVPSAVAFAQRQGKVSTPPEQSNHTALAPGQVEIWTGHTNTPNVRRNINPLYQDDGEFHSPYAEIAMQGPTIVDRRLFFATTTSSQVTLASPQVRLTYPRQTKNDKKRYDVSTLQGAPVHQNHLFDTYAGENIAPYVVLKPLTTVLPVDKSAMTLPMDHSECYEQAKASKAKKVVHKACRLDIQNLDPSMQSRWFKMSDLWVANRGPNDTKSLLDNLNWLNKLTSQLEYLRNPQGRPVRIAYTTAGRPTATLITDPKAILDTSTYQVSCSSEEEAYYLLAIINSLTLFKTVEPLMPKGQFGGARTLHKHLWKLPIPEFDLNNPDHAHLAELGAKATSEAQQTFATVENPTIANVRKAIRHKWQPNSPTAQAIEQAVSKLLDTKADSNN